VWGVEFAVGGAVALMHVLGGVGAGGRVGGGVVVGLGGKGGTSLKRTVGTFAKVVSPSTPPHTHILARPQQPTMPKKG